MRNFFASVLLAFWGLSTAAMAEQHTIYPDRPIMLVVSYGAGGATDYQARIVTKMASEAGHLNMPVAILNKPGNGGRVGWTWVSQRAKADGYTLSVYNLPHFIAQYIKGDVPYSPDSFEPIANWGADPAVLVVPADSPMNSVRDVVEFAKANPNTFTLSGAGLFVGHHIAALQLQKVAGIQMAYAPNNSGGAAALKEVITGEVMGGITNLSDAYRAQATGLVKVLGLFDLARNDILPQVPTLIEQGFDIDNASVNFRGVMVPKGTPEAIIEKLARAVPKMFADPRIAQKMAAGGAPMRIMNRQEVQMWAQRQETLTDLLSGL